MTPANLTDAEVADICRPLTQHAAFADVCALLPEGVNWGDPLTPQMVREIVDAAMAAERARCIDALLALKDRSGVNEDGRSWLVRLTRGDCVQALIDLAPTGKLRGPR